MQKQARNKVYSTLYFLVHHLNGNYEVAENFIESNRDFLLNKMSRVEINELYLYEATVYKDHGKYEEAIKVLKENKDAIVDKITRNEYLAELYEKLGKKEEAISHYEFCIDRNPSCAKHYYSLFKAHGINVENPGEEDNAKEVEIIEERIKKHPKLLFLQRFLLNFLTKEQEFRANFEKYCKRFLEKGIPSLVNDVEKTILNDPMKFKVAKETFEKYLESAQKDFTIDGEDVDPMQEAFLLFYLSQIKYLEGDYFHALDLITESLEHTPTFIEAWQFKAKIYAGLGDNRAAEEAFKQAHNLDTADRFLNAECARFVLKNGNYSEADEIMKRWSVDQVTNELNTFDLQNIWYEVESGYSHYEHKRHLEAFQMFNFIQKHVDTMQKDIYDLHFYTIRKINLRTYAKIGEMQEKIKQNKNVKNGIIGYLRTCNKLYNQYKDKEDFTTWLEEKANEHKEEEVDATKWEEYEAPHDPVDKLTDPNGAKDLKILVDAGMVNPVAAKCVEFLKSNPDFYLLHYYSIVWFLRSKKYKDAMNSLDFLIENSPDAPKTLYSCVRFKVFFDDEAISSKLKEKMKNSINTKIEQIFGSEDAKSFLTKNFAEKHSENLQGQRYLLKGLRKFIGETLTEDNVQNVFGILAKAQSDQGFKNKVLPEVNEIKKILKETPEDLKEKLVDAASQVFYKYKEIYEGPKAVKEEKKD